MNTKKTMGVVEVLLIVIGIVGGIVWYFDADGNYEPALVAIGFILLVLEVIRKTYFIEKNEGLEEAKQLILEKLDELNDSKEKANIPPPGTRVLISDSGKLTQRDKTTIPIWLASRDQYSKKEAFIQGYQDGFYVLDIDAGEHIWPGRWLTKIG